MYGTRPEFQRVILDGLGRPVTWSIHYPLYNFASYQCYQHICCFDLECVDINLVNTEVRKSHFYYGWVIVIVAALCGAAQTVDFNPVIGAFIKPMSAEFGWSRSTFIGAQSLGTLIGGFGAAFFGPLVDRHGPKWVLFLGFSLLGASFIGIGFVHSLWPYYLLTILSRVAVQSMIGIGTSVMVPKWFIKRRGRAVALSNIGTRVGVAVQPPLAIFIISVADWRWAIIVLGILTMSITLLPIAFLVKRRPEDIGLLPDGEVPAIDANTSSGSGSQGQPSKAKEISFTAKEALKTRSFYLLILAFSITFFVSTGLNINLVAFLTDRGLSNGAAAGILTTWSSVGIVGTLVTGFMADKIPVRYLAMFVYLSLAVGTVILVQVHSVPMAIAFAIFHGTIWGANNNLQVLLFSNYYGRDSLGSIRGLVSPVQTSASALGPIVSSVVFDTTGSYTLILVTFVFLLMLSAALMFMARQPSSLPEPVKS